MTGLALEGDNWRKGPKPQDLLGNQVSATWILFAERKDMFFAID
jgi:hypothetical protein